MKHLRNILEKMGWNEPNKMEKIYNGKSIIMKIKKQSNIVNQILELVDDVCDDSYITSGEIRWYFKDIDVLQNTFSKIEKILHQKEDIHGEIDTLDLNIYWNM